MLTPSAVKQFYDRFGARQDRQGFYEDAALDDLVAHADFPGAGAIVEFGCGTGRFAERVLAQASSARYVGFDVSTTMVELARGRMARFGDRAQVRQLDPGTVSLPLPDHSADRMVSTYVLDLLPEADIATFLREALRVLAPHGLLGLVSLTRGETPLPRLGAQLWMGAYRIRPQLVGGCRPVRLRPSCDPARWEVVHHRVLARWGIPSEILVAHPVAGSGGRA